MIMFIYNSNNYLSTLISVYNTVQIILFWHTMNLKNLRMTDVKD
jgi:hypothetical protein